MRTKRCKMCGCFIYDDIDCNICDCCLDDMDNSNPYTQWERGYSIGEEVDNGSREDLREQD